MLDVNEFILSYYVCKMLSLALKQTVDNQQTYPLCNIFCVQGDFTPV